MDPTLPSTKAGHGALSTGHMGEVTWFDAVGVGAGSTSLRMRRWMMIEVGRISSLVLFEASTLSLTDM